MTPISCLFGSRSALNPVLLLAGALSFDEKARQSAALFWFELRKDGILCWRAAIQLKNNWYLSRIFGTRLGEKDRGLSTWKPWTEQAGGLEAFLHGAAQNFEVVLNIQNWNQKIKYI